jgi:hypothetical protein
VTSPVLLPRTDLHLQLVAPDDAVQALRTEGVPVNAIAVNQVLPVPCDVVDTAGWVGYARVMAHFHAATLRVHIKRRYLTPAPPKSFWHRSAQTSSGPWPS